MKLKTISSLIALAVGSTSQLAAAQFLEMPYVTPSQSDFGGVGLMQTPTARMAPLGEFSVNLRNNDQYRFYSVSLQLFPWLESTIRYTDVRTRMYGAEDFSGDQTYKDKGIDVKARLWKESYWLPDVSLGIRDLGGTGLFDSEYLVTTKAAGPVDFSLGIGWGYLGNSGNISNPFCEASDRFCHRKETVDNVGSVDAERFFHGPAAIFGGMEYQTPWQPLSFKLEYDANNYEDDFAGYIKQSSPINVGAIYRLGDWGALNLSYERGNTLMAGFTLHTNFEKLRSLTIPPKKPEYHPEPQGRFLDPTVSASQLYALRDNAGLSDPTIQRNGDTLYITGEQKKYLERREGVDRANIIAMNNLPEGVDNVVVTERSKTMDMVSSTSSVASLDKQLKGIPAGQTPPADIARRGEPQTVENAEQGYYIDKSPFTFDWSPQLNQSFGGPESFYMYQIGLRGSLDYQVTNNWTVGGVAFLNLYNNYNKFNFEDSPSDSHLPHVRTHIRSYVDSSDLYLNSAQITRIGALGDGWYMQNYAGYLEMMFAGVGSEVLYRPLDSNWAVGADVNWVKQRDWNDPMRMADYSVTTGLLTGYWQPGFAPEVTVKLSAGRYLAGDKGGTLDVSRRFASGIVAGAYATLTDVSADDYGEGSFTKGFYISIPLDLLTTHPTNTRAGFNWTPLTRDGGQQLDKRYSLYSLTDARAIQP